MVDEGIEVAVAVEQAQAIFDTTGGDQRIDRLARVRSPSSTASRLVLAPVASRASDINWSSMSMLVLTDVYPSGYLYT